MKLYKANGQGGEKMAQEKKEPSRREFIKTLAGLGLGAAMAQTLYSSLNPKQRAQLVAWAQSFGKPMTYAELGRLIDAAAWDDVVRAVRYQPASYIVYQAPDGSYQAKNGNTGQIEFSGTDAASVIQQAINALPNGGKILLKNGVYTLTPKFNNVFGHPTCLQLSGGIVIEGESMFGTILDISGAVDSYSLPTIFTNKNTTVASGGDNGIVIRRLTFKARNVVSGVGYANWGVGCDFAGAYNTKIEEVYGNYCHIASFNPLYDATTAQKQTYSGKNYNNKIIRCIATNGVDSNRFSWGIDCLVKESEFYNWGDDVFLVAEWARNIKFRGCIFDGSGHENVGGSNGQIFAMTDASSPNPNDPRMVEVNIYDCIFRANIQNGGHRAGIAGNQGSTIRVYRSLIEQQPATAGTLAPMGGGIISAGILTVKDCEIRNNYGMGIAYFPHNITNSLANSLESAVIEGNIIYNNNLGNNTNYAGLNINGGYYLGGSVVPFDWIVRKNIFFDNQAIPTQTIGLRTDLTVGMGNQFLIIEENDFTRQPGTAIYVVGALIPANGVKSVKGNFGYNPQGFAITTPAMPTSGTAQSNTFPFPVIVYLYGGTVTQITINGQVVFSSGTGISLTGQSFTLNPGDTIAITYTAAPTWKWYGL